MDGDGNYVRVQVLTNAGAPDRDKQLAAVRELTDIVAASAGDPSLVDRTWVQLIEAPDGGWGLNGHANTNDELRLAARAQIAELPRTRRRRTGGLRREEVADLSNMSTDYYSRIEQQRGPRPSEQMLAAIARALRLDPQQRDHLFHLAGYPTPQRVTRTDHVNPGMSAIFERMRDTPAVIFNQLGETLAQNPLATLLLGDQTGYTGPRRALAYRWFTDPAERALFPEQDHARHGRTIAAQLRGAQDRDSTDPRVQALVDALRRASPEFAQIWSEHPVAGPYCPPKRIEHPRLGTLDLHGQSLLDPDQSQLLTVFTAPTDSESHDKLLHLAGHLV